MGIFSKMFGDGLPESKYDIIKRFAKIRMEKLKKTDSEFAFQAAFSGMDDIDNWDNMMLEGLPESNIITMVDAYFSLKEQGFNDSAIFEEMNEFRSSYDPYPNPNPMPSDLNLKKFIYYRLEFELPNENGIEIGENGFTRDFIEKVFDETYNLYSRNY